MAATTYNYSISGDFPNHVVDPDKLHNEVVESAIVIAIDHVSVAGDVCSVAMKDALSQGDETILDGIVAVHDGEPLPDPGLPVSVSNEELAVGMVGKVVTDLTSDSRLDLFSINLCDKCSWYPDSVAVVDEVLTPDGTYETYSSAHTHWIDLYHGRVSDEDDIVAQYPIVVKVNDVAKLMDTPLKGLADKDFSINPVSGTITFHTPLSSGDVVKASYKYATTSGWTITPTSGKKLELLAAECQLSEDIDMKDTIQYQVFVGPYPVKTKKYKRVVDFINESNGAYPEVPAFGGATRGISHPIFIFPWLYKAKTTLLSSIGMKIKVSLANHTPCEGEHAVVTFYCLSVNE